MSIQIDVSWPPTGNHAYTVARGRKIWAKTGIDFLAQNYPSKGRDWCAKELGISAAAVRAKASRMGLKSRGTSDAWHAERAKHSARLTGRKRPDQSVVMRKMHVDGRLSKTPEQLAAGARRLQAYRDANGHPRGALGMKHSHQSRLAMSAKQKRRWDSKSPEQKDAQVLQLRLAAFEAGVVPGMRLNATWKASWREIGGVRKFYRSKWEANYARYLQWLKEAGQIAGWEHEPKTFWFEGIKRGVMSYLPDFRVYENDGAERYHEVKGWMDARSKTKIKRMAKYHPSVRLLVVDSKAYRRLEKQVRSMVRGWE